MTNISEMQDLSERWLAAKEAERQAVEERRQIEDRLSSLIGIAETLEEPQRIVRLVLEVEADQPIALVRRHAQQQGRLLAAGQTPRPPDIEHGDLSLEVGRA